MRTYQRGILMTCILGLSIAASAVAQQQPKVAIIPTQYFSADEPSADNVTQALAQEFQRRGYNVISTERGMTAFQELGLNRSRDIGDREALRFGRRTGADLVVHPQLLAVGIQAVRGSAIMTGAPPSAVLYLRVLNARSGKGIYTRQIAYDLTSERPFESESLVGSQVASGAVSEVSRNYFERVAGSRQEFRRRR